MDISPDRLWTQVLERLQQQLSRPTFETWIKTTTVEQLESDRLTIRTPNPFAKNWLQKYYIKTIGDVVAEIAGKQIEIVLTVSQADDTTTDNSSVFSWSLPNPKVTSEKTSERTVHPTQLNHKYIFSRFVVGSHNRMAHAASLAVAESPGREFNPLFLCGGVGLGKTHLMQAIGHYRLEISPESKIFYVSTEKFTNDLMEAIRKGSTHNFREHYRAADVLLVDDIQFIEGKEYTQEEFFYTFNTLHESGKQIVIASDRPPKQISRLQERLCSRFSMGLIADIQQPDLETRMAILQKKAEYENVDLPRNVIEYIAVNYTSNIRELEGALIRSVAYMSISGLPMTVENIAPVLSPQSAIVPATPMAVIQAIADVFKISIEDLKGNSRRREISLARQIGMYLMRHHTDLSFPRIGEEFGGKDHTTVLYSYEKISQLRKTDPDMAKTIAQLSDRINFSSHS